MPRLQTHRLVVVALAATLLGGVVAAPTATKEPVIPDDPAGATTTEVEAIGAAAAFDLDCRLVAKQFGWKLSQTRRHMKHQALFAVTVAKLENSFGQLFAGSAFSPSPGAAASVYIKGDTVPKKVARLVGKLSKRTKLDIKMNVGMRYSVKDQEERLAAMESALQQRGINCTGGAVLLDDVIQMTLPATEDFPESDERELLAALSERRPDENAAKLLGTAVDTTGVYIAFTKGEETDADLHARGGRLVYADDTDGDGFISICTSGFSVYRVSDSLNGIATAAHCTGMVNFDAEAPEGDFGLSHKGEHNGAYGDVEWKTSSHLEPAEFWANVGDLRDVNSVTPSFSKNDVHCIYSRMQATRTCDQVYSTSVTQNGAKKLVALDGNHAIGGDSGGPVSYSTEAAGVVKGYKTIWFKKRTTFTRANNFERALGVWPRTK